MKKTKKTPLPKRKHPIEEGRRGWWKLVLLVGAVHFLVGVFLYQKSLSDAYSSPTWTQEQLAKEEARPYEVLSSVWLEEQETVRSWVNNQKQNAGVHQLNDGTHLYVLISEGTPTDKDAVIELHDVKQNVDSIFIGYRLVPEEGEPRLSTMLLRMEASEQTVIGKTIQMD